MNGTAISQREITPAIFFFFFFFFKVLEKEKCIPFSRLPFKFIGLRPSNRLCLSPIKVKRNTSTVIGNYEDGGLKMPHVLSLVHALKISSIERVLDPDNYAPWKVLFTDVLEDLGQDKFWYYSQSALKVLSAKFNPF